NIGDDIFYGDFEVEQMKLNIYVRCNGQTISHFVSSRSVISLIKIQTSNPFLYKEKAQYCLKWMKEYYFDNLKLQKPRKWTNWIWRAPQLNEVRSDYDPDKILELSQSECETFMKKWFSKVMDSSVLQQDMFFNYLYVQFVALANSLYLKNKLVFDHSIQYKHEATECAIDIAQDLCFHSYNYITIEEKDIDFFYVKSEKNPKNFCIDQSRWHVIPIQNTYTYIFDIYTKDYFEKQKEDLRTMIYEDGQKKRLRFLLYALGVPKQEQERILNKLSTDILKHYVLTYDN
ncbi:hypothetical protein RFI_34541, partial [Reticulomyxa filosa]